MYTLFGEKSITLFVFYARFGFGCFCCVGCCCCWVARGPGRAAGGSRSCCCCWGGATAAAATPPPLGAPGMASGRPAPHSSPPPYCPSPPRPPLLFNYVYIHTYICVHTPYTHTTYFFPSIPFSVQKHKQGAALYMACMTGGAPESARRGQFRPAMGH